MKWLNSLTQKKDVAYLKLWLWPGLNIELNHIPKLATIVKYLTILTEYTLKKLDVDPFYVTSILEFIETELRRYQERIDEQETTIKTPEDKTQSTSSRTGGAEVFDMATSKLSNILRSIGDNNPDGGDD